VRSKNFSFGFTENISKFVILGGTMEILGADSTRYIEFA